MATRGCGGGGWSLGDGVGGLVTRRGGARDWSPGACGSGDWSLADMQRELVTGDMAWDWSPEDWVVVETGHLWMWEGLVTRSCGVGLPVFDRIESLELANKKYRGWTGTMAVQGCEMYLMPLNCVH